MAPPLAAAPGAVPADDDLATRLRRTARSIRVLVAGSLNLDQILTVDGAPDDDSTLFVRKETQLPGGHAGNCAAALTRLGLSVTVLGAVGTDADGDRLVQDLGDRGVDVGSIRRYRQAATGRVIIPIFRDRHFMLMARGANDLLVADDVCATLKAGQFDAVVAFDPAAAALHALASANPSPNRLSYQRSAGSPPLFWTPGGLYAGTAEVAALAPTCDTLFLNSHEQTQVVDRIGSLPGGDAGPEVVVTLGAAGSRLHSAGTIVQVAAPVVNVVDPTGAGDAYTAAYVLARLAGLPTLPRLRFANAAGALAVTALGARGHLASLDDLIGAAADFPPASEDTQS